jgi:hypothetical protein
MRTFGTELYMPVLVLLMTCQAGAGSGKKVTTSLLTGGLMVGVHASTRTPSLRIQYGQSRIHCEKWRVGQVCACGVNAGCRTHKITKQAAVTIDRVMKGASEVAGELQRLAK